MVPVCLRPGHFWTRDLCYVSYHLLLPPRLVSCQLENKNSKENIRLVKPEQVRPVTSDITWKQELDHRQPSMGGE